MENTPSWSEVSLHPSRGGRRLLWRRVWRRLCLLERNARPYWTAILLFSLLVLACFVPLAQAVT